MDDKAPQQVEFLWQLAILNDSYEAIHAMRTGPELSCPLPANMIPKSLSDRLLSAENATSYPVAGEVVLVRAPDDTITDLPKGNYFDLGIFYGEGGRSLFPFGWLKGDVCSKIDEENLEGVRRCCARIRRTGICKSDIEPG